jgi:predicted dehydrogenase
VEVSVCEPNRKLRESITDRYEVASAYDGLDVALADSFHMAVVATPAQLHISQAIQLVGRGVNTLIEKPVSLVRDGIGELRNALDQSRLIAGVAYPYRAHPALAAMRDSIASNRFGRPLQVVVVAGQNFPTYRPAFRDTYYRSRETGGGAIQDALTHLINAVEWIVGPTTSVVADAARLKLDGVEVEDTAQILTRNGDVLTNYSLNQHQPANELSITVICEHGQARFENHRAKWSWLQEVDGAWQEEAMELDRDTLFRRQADAFLDAVEGHAQPLCNLNDGVATLETVLSALKSLESKQWENVAKAI